MLVFWASCSVGASAALVWWIYYLRHSELLHEDRRKRDRNVQLIIAVAPFLGILGFALQQYGRTSLQFGFYGFASSFIFVAMVGYGALVLYQKRKRREQLSDSS